MAGAGNGRLGLLVSSPPGASRESRSDPDVALAAMSLDFALDVYFLGSAVLQLAGDVRTAAAQLPPGYKAWAALHDLGDIRLFAEAIWVDRCTAQGIEWTIRPQALDPRQFARQWRACRAVWSL